LTSLYPKSGFGLFGVAHRAARSKGLVETPPLLTGVPGGYFDRRSKNFDRRIEKIAEEHQKTELIEAVEVKREAALDDVKRHLKRKAFSCWN
jgi:hypothetical protein